MSYHILVVEDEPLVAKRLLRLVSEIPGDREQTLGHAASVGAAERLLETKEYDLILLDLNLAGEDGFDLLKRFTAKAAHTIVVSAQTERALEAFEYGVLDFVPKPFTKKRLEKALSRLWDFNVKPQVMTKQLAFETNGGFEVIALSDILFFKGIDKYSEAALTNGNTRFHGKSLSKLEHILNSGFVRTHKSFLVQQSAIAALKSLEGSRYMLQLTNGQELPVGRTRIDLVRQTLGA